MKAGLRPRARWGAAPHPGSACRSIGYHARLVRKRLRRGTAFCATAASVVLLAACGSSIPGNAIVRVGDATVSKAAFDHWLIVANNSNYVGSSTAAPPTPIPPDYTACVNNARAQAIAGGSTTVPSAATERATCASDYSSLEQTVTSFLAQAIWVQGEAVDRGVHVSTKQVNAEYKKLIKADFPTSPSFKTFEEQSQETVADLKWRVMLNLLENGIRAKATKASKDVSAAAVHAYYESHLSSYGTPERRNIHLVLVASAATAAKVRSLLAGGASYATVAKQYSTDTTSKSAGGQLLGVQKGEETLAFSNAIFAAKKGVLSGPVKTPFGYYVFTVDAITPATQQTFAQAKKKIRATLVSNRQSAELTKLGTDFTKKWQPRTQCRTGYIVSGICANAPASSTGSTGSSSSSG